MEELLEKAVYKYDERDGEDYIMLFFRYSSIDVRKLSNLAFRRMQSIYRGSEPYIQTELDEELCTMSMGLQKLIHKSQRAAREVFEKFGYDYKENKDILALMYGPSVLDWDLQDKNLITFYDYMDTLTWQIEEEDDESDVKEFEFSLDKGLLLPDYMLLENEIDSRNFNRIELFGENYDYDEMTRRIHSLYDIIGEDHRADKIRDRTDDICEEELINFIRYELEEGFKLCAEDRELLLHSDNTVN